jgi:hypothetical protein
MLKGPETMKELERAARVLENLIGEVPAILLKSIEVEAQSLDHHIDILAHISV